MVCYHHDYSSRLYWLNAAIATTSLPSPQAAGAGADHKQSTNLLNSQNSKYSQIVKTIQTWLQTAPLLYNIQSILGTLVLEDVREETNARNRGDPLVWPGFGIFQVSSGGTEPDGRPNQKGNLLFFSKCPNVPLFSSQECVHCDIDHSS